VNNLKLSNDVFGHEEGDRLLKTIANSIRKACRQSDIVARWGGDEFAFILPGTDRATAEELCNRIGQIAGESKGTVIRPSIAVGLAAKEQRGQNIYQTIRQAEQDMYDYKIIHAGENEGEVFSSLLARVRDRVTGYGGHLDRSRELGRRFGSEAGLNEELAKDLDLLIEMHDIGKAILPRETLAKPGPLTHEEWDIMKKHSEAGFRIVKTFADTSKISDDVLSHAEHWDGSGYPRGLKGKEIPYLCRIFQIVDAFDVMTHPRTYARYLTQEEALAELRRNAGKQFDPELTEAFIWMVTGGAEAKAPV
jgi:diguanylate cyclase (GGDEF)-like protein